MTQPLQQRINYHPDPRSVKNSDRKVMSRLTFITSKVDFKDKVVLDLGCSGGFFAFELSKVARKVIAVDGDPEIIKRNRALQKEMAITNIEFISSEISSDTIEAIGEVDITLFLSVFHHMLTASDAYDWNFGVNSDDIDKMLSTLNQNTSTLVFEMGEVNEGYEWCERMPQDSLDNKNFVIEKVFQGAFTDVDVYNRLQNINFINASIVSKLGRAFKRDTRIISIIKRLSQFDSRDLRKIYIGKK